MRFMKLQATRFPPIRFPTKPFCIVVDFFMQTFFLSKTIDFTHLRASDCWFFIYKSSILRQIYTLVNLTYHHKISIGAKCTALGRCRQHVVASLMAFYSLLSFSHSYFSPRRGCPRILNFSKPLILCHPPLPSPLSPLCPMQSKACLAHVWCCFTSATSKYNTTQD